MLTVNSSIWEVLGLADTPKTLAIVALPLNTSLSKEFMTINRIVNISSIDVHDRPTSIMARYDREFEAYYYIGVSTVGA